jgi:signal transduction histidine kinase
MNQALISNEFSLIIEQLARPISLINLECDTLISISAGSENAADFEHINRATQRFSNLLDQLALNGTFPTDFAYTRHELRTPLSQIIGYAELVEEIAQEDGRTELLAGLQIIKMAAHQLISLVGDHFRS